MEPHPSCRDSAPEGALAPIAEHRVSLPPGSTQAEGEAPAVEAVRMMWLTLPIAALWSLPIGIGISSSYPFPWNSVVASARASEMAHLGLVVLVIVATISSWKALHVQSIAGLSSARWITLGLFNVLSGTLSPFFLLGGIGSFLD